MTAEFYRHTCGNCLWRYWHGKATRQRAGLRTLIAPGSALFMIVSKYGLLTLSLGHVGLDPSRIAAQVVTASGLSVQVTFSFVTKIL